MHHSSQAKIDAALAKRPPGLDQMALPDLRDTVGKALGDQLTDLEEKFAGPSPRSKGQRVTQLDPENQHLVVKVHENPNKACKATGTTIGQLLKNANRGNITLYSKTLTKKVCFRYATEEEAASIAPSVDSKSAAKAAFEAVVNRPSNKRHSKDAVPVTQLDPKNQGAYVCTFGSITVASEKTKISNSLLQSKIKDAHEKGEPHAVLYAYRPDAENALNVIDAVECWFRYATEEEAATLPPELQQRRRGLGRRRSRRPARAAASKDRTATEEEGVDSPAATSKPRPASFTGAIKRSSMKIDGEDEWLPESEPDDESEFEGESDEASVCGRT
jgi:hypothetical protein